MDDVSGTLFCDDCANDAIDRGVFAALDAILLDDDDITVPELARSVSIDVDYAVRYLRIAVGRNHNLGDLVTADCCQRGLDALERAQALLGEYSK